MALFRQRRRVRAISPSNSFAKLHHLSSSVRDCRLQKTHQLLDISDTCSVTAESEIFMPRPAPRLELANMLRQGKYVECMDLERKSLQNQLLKASLLYSRHKRQNFRVKRGLTSRYISKRMPRRVNLQFLFVLMQYVHNLSSYNYRSMFILSLLSERYLETRLPLPKTFAWLTQILPNSPDTIFEAHTRMTRRSFGMLLHILETKAPQFFKRASGRYQLPISIQLRLAIFTLGFYGNGANFESARAKFGYGVRTVLNARRRVVDVITSLTTEYIKWPDASKRRQLCREVKQKHAYHSAFFAVDGTTHPFAFVPSYQRNSWFDRKSRYSMQALVSNDIHLRVIHLVVGWPGSTQDARVLGSADFMQERNEARYFDGEQHGLGDAAFGMHKRVVPNYKEPLASIPENTEYNRMHSSLRVRSEHAIGHVKNRFQGLKEVRLRLRNKKEVLEIVKYITAGYVLHNMLLDFEDEYRASANSLDRQEEEIAVHTPDDVGTLAGDVGTESAAAHFREKVKDQVLNFIGYH